MCRPGDPAAGGWAMANRGERRPGDPAPATGHYEELNLFGTPTGRVYHATEGEPLPVAPRSFTWQRVVVTEYDE